MVEGKKLEAMFEKLKMECFSKNCILIFSSVYVYECWVVQIWLQPPIPTTETITDLLFSDKYRNE